MEARQVFGSLPDGYLERITATFCSKCGSRCRRLKEHLPHTVCTGCGHMQFVQPSVGVTILVVAGGGVLLCRRTEYAGFGGLWCLPGGHIEYNEDFLSAGLREVEEETGLQVEITGLLSVVSTFWDHTASTFSVVLLASPVGGELQPDNHETTETGWFQPDALPELAFEADAHIIERYFAVRESGASVEPAYSGREGRDPAYSRPAATRHPERGKRW